MKVLFVCTANRFRSPTAMIVAKKLGMKVDSAGCYDGEFEQPLPTRVRVALERKGYKADHHLSKPVTEELMEWADKVVYMIPHHYEVLKEKFPTHARKCIALGAYANPPMERIPDPMIMKGSDFHWAIRLIERCVKRLVRGLRRK